MDNNYSSEEKRQFIKAYYEYLQKIYYAQLLDYLKKVNALHEEDRKAMMVSSYFSSKNKPNGRGKNNSPDILDLVGQGISDTIFQLMKNSSKTSKVKQRIVRLQSSLDSFVVVEQLAPPVLFQLPNYDQFRNFYRKLKQISPEKSPSKPTKKADNSPRSPKSKDTSPKASNAGNSRITKESAPKNKN